MDTSSLESAIPQTSFEEQFSDIKTIESNAGKLKYVEISPPNEIVVDKTPIVVIPGWSITLGTEKQLLKNLGARNNVVSCEFPRLGGEVNGNEDLADEVVRQAELVADLIKTQEGKVDIVGQSMAAIDILAAIKLYPELLEKIRTIVITSPAGLSGDDNLLKLMGRFVNHTNQNVFSILTSQIERRNLIKMNINGSFYIGKNLPRSLKEANAIAVSDEYAGLNDMKKQFEEHGIMLGFIQGESDKLTPAKKLWDKIGEDSKPVWVELTQEEYDKEPEYQERGINVGAIVFNRYVTNPSPPFDAITMIKGGHDNRIYGDQDFGNIILRARDVLNKMRENGGIFVSKE